MLNNKQLILIASTLLAISQLCAGCSAEDITAEAPTEMGALCLSLSSDEVFIETKTGTTDNYVWALQITGENYSNNEFQLEENIIIPAGTYTFSATNASAEYNVHTGPLYEGSVEFEVKAGEQNSVVLDLGKPQNAKITLILTKNFKDAYENVGLKKLDGEPIRLNEGENFSPIGEYTITANAKKGSGVQEFTNNSTITLSRGTHTTLKLDVNPITGYIKIDNGGTHTGEFQ